MEPNLDKMESLVRELLQACYDAGITFVGSHVRRSTEQLEQAAKDLAANAGGVATSGGVRPPSRNAASIAARRPAPPWMKLKRRGSSSRRT